MPASCNDEWLAVVIIRAGSELKGAVQTAEAAAEARGRAHDREVQRLTREGAQQRSLLQARVAELQVGLVLAALHPAVADGFGKACCAQCAFIDVRCVIHALEATCLTVGHCCRNCSGHRLMSIHAVASAESWDASGID